MDFKQKTQLSKIPQTIKAVTLIEVLMYLFFFAMFFVVIVQFYFFLDRQSDIAQGRIELDRTQVFIDQHLTTTFENTSTIDMNASTFDTNPSSVTLVLNTTDSVSYIITDGRLQYIDTSGNSSYLTQERVVVTNFEMSLLTSPQNQQLGIKLNIDVESTKSGGSLSRNINQNYYIKAN